MTQEQWDDVIQTNLKSVFNMTRLVMRPMMKAKIGSIINMSSVIGEMGNAGQSSYAASKAGVIGFTKSIAKELGSRNIRCNAIAPGTVDTPSLADRINAFDDPVAARKMFVDRQPMGRLAQPEEIAPIVVYLASDESVFATGQVFAVSLVSQPSPISGLASRTSSRTRWVLAPVRSAPSPMSTATRSS